MKLSLFKLFRVLQPMQDRHSVLWQALISTSRDCFQVDPSGTVGKEVLYAAETMRIMRACACHFFKRMLVMLISFISCQLVCVSMRPKDLCLLAFKTYAWWRFTCNILIFTVRVCAPKKRAIKKEINFWEGPF